VLGWFLTAAAAAHTIPAAGALRPVLCSLLNVQVRVPERSGLALTFDDGPDPGGTPAVLEALAAHDARATFFLAGEQVERFPALAREVRDAGHEVGLHCHRHRNPLHMTPFALAEDLRRATESIAAATGVAPRLYRPPYGRTTGAALALARHRGWRTVLWSRDPRDWRPSSTAASIVETCRAAQAGDVVLFHDSDAYAASGTWERTAAALPRILSEARGRGLAANAI
jgi:peptidoglycan-N-acetylglucosamine deacetylase